MINDQILAKIPVLEIQKKSTTILTICQPELSHFLQSQFDEVLENDTMLAEIIYNLRNSSAQGVIFGGWVRDRIISFQRSRRISSRDIDFVVTGLEQDELEKLLNSATANIFGGFTAQTLNNKIDIWLLKNTFLIRRNNLAVTFEELPSTTVFQVNSAIFKPSQLWNFSETLESGCINAIDNCFIDFQSNIIPFPLVQVARALTYSVKLRFNLSQEIKSFIKQSCSCESNIKLVEDGLQKNCPEEFFFDIMKLFELTLNS